MKKQISIFSQQARESEKPRYVKIVRLVLGINEGKEFCTKGGVIVLVKRHYKSLSGVGPCEFFTISDQGKETGPFTSVGVKNYMERN